MKEFIAMEEGEYRNFTGAIFWGDNDGVVKKAKFSLIKKNNEHIILFYRGIWMNGVFSDGVFTNGIFKNGIFQRSSFWNGVFVNGETDEKASFRGGKVINVNLIKEN